MAGKKLFKYMGLGFPVFIANAPILQTEFGEVLDINPNIVSRLAFNALIEKPSGFTGAQVKFIRHFFEKNQGDFAEMVGVDRTTVNKWEGKGEGDAGMNLQTQIVLRLKMAVFLKLDLNITITRIEPAARMKRSRNIVLPSLPAIAARSNREAYV